MPGLSFLIFRVELILSPSWLPAPTVVGDTAFRIPSPRCLLQRPHQGPLFCSSFLQKLRPPSPAAARSFGNSHLAPHCSHLNRPPPLPSPHLSPRLSHPDSLQLQAGALLFLTSRTLCKLSRLGHTRQPGPLGSSTPLALTATLGQYLSL